MNNSATIVDIETGPLPAAQLALLKPLFVASKVLKDAEKIRMDLADKEAAWVDRAALSALTGQVLAIGLMDDVPRIRTGPEPALLRTFWDLWGEGGRFVGFACKGFDFPFLFQRSLILGIQTPPDLFEGRYWSRRVIDLQELWNCFSSRVEGQSLDAVCKSCGLGGKSGSGADFHKLFTDNPQAALAYCEQDLRLTHRLAIRLGVLTPQKTDDTL